MGQLLFLVKKISCKHLFCFYVATVLFSSVIHAQRLEGGEFITKTINGGWGATAHYVYYIKEHEEEGFFINSGHWEQAFLVPGNQTITDIGAKAGSGDERILVLLSDGSVYEVDRSLRTLSNTWIGHIGASGSESWQKVLGDAIFALSSSYLRVSRDNGATWQVDSAGISTAGRIWDLAQDTSFANLYAGTNSKGLYKKDTLPGSVWNKVTSFTGTTNVFKVYIDRLNRILVAGNGSNLWISNDGGLTWPIDTVGLGNNGTLTVFGDDVHNNLYGAISGKLYKSINGTQPWQRIDAGILALSGNAPTYNAISGDTLLFVGTNFGNFVSADQGATWAKADSGIVAENFYGFAKLPNNKKFAATSLGVFKKNPGDTVWSKSYPQIGYSGQVPVYADNAGVLYALDNNITHNNNAAAPIVKSTDQGATWTLDSAGLSSVTGNLFYIDETGTQHYASTLYGSSFPDYIWKRTPPGGWIMDTTGLVPKSYDSNTSMASDKNGYLYVSGSYASGNKVMRRPIGGGSWVVDTTGLGSVSYFTKMATGYHGDVVGISYNYKLVHRGTGTWSSISLPSSISFPTPRVVSVDSGGNIFVAFTNVNNVYKGVYRTNNFGNSWTYVGLDSITVTQLISYNDTTYALTTNGLFALTAPSTIPLPLQFISVKASQQQQGITIEWSIANEDNAEKYELERSSDGRSFSVVGIVPARNKASDETYSWPDNQPNTEVNYYRIKLIERTGNVLYSQIVKINTNKKQPELIVYPNPTNGVMTIQLVNLKKGKYKMSLYDNTGRTLFAKDIEHETESEAFSVSIQTLSKGSYYLQVKGEQTWAQRILIQ